MTPPTAGLYCPAPGIAAVGSPFPIESDTYASRRETMGSNGERIESFLIDLGLPYEKLADGIWVLVNEADLGENLVVYLSEPVLSLRLKLFELPEDPGTTIGSS